MAEVPAWFWLLVIGVAGTVIGKYAPVVTTTVGRFVWSKLSECYVVYNSWSTFEKVVVGGIVLVLFAIVATAGLVVAQAG